MFFSLYTYLAISVNLKILLYTLLFSVTVHMRIFCADLTHVNSEDGDKRGSVPRIVNIIMQGLTRRW